MTNGLSRVHFVESVRTRLSADRGFLFDDRTGRVYTLNATAAFVTARLREQVAIDNVVTAVTEAFQADETTARRDLEKFLAQLVSEGLGRVEEDDGRG